MSTQSHDDRPRTFFPDYDCRSGENCYVKRHMMDYSALSALLPSHNRFTDIDGVLETEDGKVLFLEVKRENYDLKPVQKILHRNLSMKERQSTLVIWRGRNGEPTKCQWITKGKEREVIDLPGGMEDLKRVVQTWISF